MVNLAAVGGEKWLGAIQTSVQYNGFYQNNKCIAHLMRTIDRFQCFGLEKKQFRCTLVMVKQSRGGNFVRRTTLFSASVTAYIMKNKHSSSNLLRVKHNIILAGLLQTEDLR